MTGSDEREERQEGSEREAGRIERLDQRTIDRIAAGEVVERPASAVKELVENALDAEATRITVDVESGGSEGITVRDNGIGMAEGDVRRAVEKHTTSKISDISDLEDGVGSLGFRGEALSAIGAVSELSIRTKPRDGAGGTELLVRGGEIESVSTVGCPAGTTVEVSDLFFNVPARRKYLKREATEFAHVSRVVTGYALANPDVAVSLSHNGRERFATAGSGDLREAVLATYGREVAAAMRPVGEGSHQDHPEETGETGTEETDDWGKQAGSVSGLISSPETTRASASYVTTIVNGRYVTARAIREAIVEAYGSQLAPDRYPFAVVRIEVPPETIDVNVHPRKLEVRFENERELKDHVGDRVERALLDGGLVRSGAPRGKSAPEQTRIDPTSGTESADRTDDPTDGTDNEERSATQRPSSPEAEPSSTSAEPATDADAGISPSESSANEIDEEATSDERRRSAASTEGDDSERATRSSGGIDGSGTSDRTDVDTVRSGTGSVDGGGTEANPHAHIDRGQRRVGTNTPETTEQRSLDGSEATTSRAFDRLPAMRVLGQLDETYVVAESESGLVLIDQHAADERINYERLCERLPSGDAQTLATPVTLELTASEAALFEAATETLASLGFYASWADGSDPEKDSYGDGEPASWTVEVRTVPAAIADCDPGVLRDVLAAFVEGERPERTIEETADALVADMACYPSITAHTGLATGSILELLTELDDCENPYACPHGRPVVIEFGHEEIDDRFERDYPGHTGRRE